MTLNDTQFSHIIGRIRSMESQILTENEINRMIGAANIEEAFRILNETAYSNHVLDVQKPNDFQGVINNELLETADFLKKVAPIPENLNILWYYYDIHNIKTLLKGKLEKIWQDDIDKLLIPLGSFNLEKLKNYFRIENAYFEEISFSKHKELIVKTIKQIEIDFEQHGDFQIIDLTLDKLYFTLINDIAIRTGDNFILNFVIKNIDLFNIGVLLRLKIKDVNPDKIKKIFVENGSFNLNELEKLTEKSLDELPSSFKEYHYKVIGQKTLEEFNISKTIVNFNKLATDLMTSFIQEAKIIPSGIAPVIAFFFAKNNNAQIIRMILLSKIAGIDQEIIRKHLRQLY